MVEFHEKTRFLFEPHRYKILYGGRAGIKSWSVARALLILAAQRKLRIACTRETQSSLKESVHQLLEEQIELCGLPGYQVEKSVIRSSTGSEFLFAGIREASVDQIKSFEGCDICWVEEGNNVTDRSWRKLIPTIRKPGSEIWVTFNPELYTDACYQRWVVNPPPNAMVVRTSWRDNRWISEEALADIQYLESTNPEEFRHVYEGECITNVHGAIFGREIKAADAEGRIGKVPYNRARPVDTVWDLGFGDATAIWFVQLYDGTYHFIDYEEDSGQTIQDWLIRLQAKGYVYGTDWLPHDGIDTIIHRKLAGGDRSMSIEQLMRQAGRNVRIVPKLLRADRINAGRTIFPNSKFDQVACQDGLDALRHYQWGETKENGMARRDPLHNWASHGADAFTEAAVALRQPKCERIEVPKVTPIPRRVMPSQYAPFG